MAVGAHRSLLAALIVLHCNLHPKSRLHSMCWLAVKKSLTLSRCSMTTMQLALQNKSMVEHTDILEQSKGDDLPAAEFVLHQSLPYIFHFGQQRQAAAGVDSWTHMHPSSLGQVARTCFFSE
eukprot:1138866-Pelagomonas_calceolata.AAC.13